MISLTASIATLVDCWRQGSVVTVSPKNRPLGAMSACAPFRDIEIAAIHMRLFDFRHTAHGLVEGPQGDFACVLQTTSTNATLIQQKYRV